MTTQMTVTAACLHCDWTTTGPGAQWDHIQKQADRHCAVGHPVAVTAEPAKTSTEGKQP
jgi:hypothetical protein